MNLVFPTSQEYEVVLRDSSGLQIWRWSDGYAFAQAVHEKIVARLTYSVDIPLMQNGRGLPEGTYTVEAWLTTEPRRFASAANLVVQSAVQE